MLSDDWTENNEVLISALREYFGENTFGFFSWPLQNQQDFYTETLIYRNFKVRFSLGDVHEGGTFGVDVYIGDWYVDLETLTNWDESISLNFTKESILQTLKVLDEYLQWCMTDAQKKTFGLL